MEELLDKMYCDEYPEWGFKIKNLSQSEQYKIYEKIEKFKKDGIKEDDDKFTFEMFKEIIECNKEINFKTMKYEDFKILLNSDFVKETFEDLCFIVGKWVARIIKNGLRMQILKVEKQEVELANLELQLAINRYYESACNIERTDRERKKRKKQISRIKKGDFDSLLNINRKKENRSGL